MLHFFRISSEIRTPAAFSTASVFPGTGGRPFTGAAVVLVAVVVAVLTGVFGSAGLSPPHATPIAAAKIASAMVMVVQERARYDFMRNLQMSRGETEPWDGLF